MSPQAWTALGEVLAGCVALLTLVWGLWGAHKRRQQDDDIHLDRYLTRSLDGFAELAENLQAEAERQRKEREAAEKRSFQREQSLMAEIAALRREVGPLRREVKLLRDALTLNGIPLPEV